MKTNTYGRKMILFAGIVVALIVLLTMWSKKETEPLQSPIVSFKIHNVVSPWVMIKETGESVLKVIL